MFTPAANQIAVQPSSSFMYHSPVSCWSTVLTNTYFTQILFALSCQPWLIMFTPCLQCPLGQGSLYSVTQPSV